METFDMYGVESIHCENEYDTKHEHEKGDKCHRCGSINTEINTDCVSGFMYWYWLECEDCKLGMIFAGGRED